MTRSRSPFVFTATLLACALSPFGAQAADTSLESVFARMDKAASTFRGMTANIKRTTHTELVNANEVDEGVITVKRSKKGETAILIDFQRPEPKKIFIGNGKGQVYNPKTNEVQEAELGKHRGVVNEFLLLGFGNTSADLLKSYTVKFGGPDPVNGVPATRIELVPKTREILNYIKKCELWIPDNGIPLEQKFDQGGGDFQISTYSNMTLNPNLPDLKLDLPKGVKVDKIK